MFDQNSSNAGYVVELWPHNVLTFGIDESPLSLRFYSGVAHVESAHFFKLGIDDNLARVVYIAPAAANVYRRAILLENPRLVEYRIDHNLAPVVDIPPLLPRLHWDQPFAEASRQNDSNHRERGTPCILILARGFREGLV